MNRYSKRIVYYLLFFVGLLILIFISILLVSGVIYNNQITTATQSKHNTEVAFETLNASTLTPSPTISNDAQTLTPSFGTETPTYTLTSTSNLPCTDKVSDLIANPRMYSQPSLALSINSTALTVGQEVLVYGKLEDEPWFFVEIDGQSQKGWVKSSALSDNCVVDEKKYGELIGKSDIFYESFRGIHDWISPQRGELIIRENDLGIMRLIYTGNRNYAELLETLPINGSFVLNMQFSVPKDWNRLGIKSKDAFITIELLDAEKHNIQFYLYFDCSYGVGNEQRIYFSNNDCQVLQPSFLELVFSPGNVSGQLNGQLITPVDLPSEFEFRNIKLTLVAHPETDFDYLFFTEP